MKRLASIAFALLLAAPAFAQIRGSWTATPSEKDPGRFHLNMTRKDSNNGQTMSISDFAGLSAAQINASTSTPVQFELRREAGTVTYEGTFKGGYGAGQFSFAPSRSYEAAIRALGVKGDRNKRGDGDIDDEDLLHLAIHDVSSAFIRSMQAEGFNETLDQYMAMRIFRVNPELVREFRAIGFTDLDAQDLISSQIHGATPQYIREMRAGGFNKLNMEGFVASRIHGVTPQFAREMGELGYKNLDFDDLTAFRIHGVTSEFVRELRELGYKNIDSDDLVAMRIHGVTPAFIRELRDAGYSNVPVEKLVSMRIHGIDANFVKKMNGSK
jgi:hypothetical protein